MEDSAKAAVKFLTDDYAIDTVTRVAPGRIAGEWLCVNDSTKQAFVVQLVEEYVLECDSYDEAIEKYGHMLEDF